MRSNRKIEFNNTDAYFVLTSMDFNECIQFAQEYMEYKEKGDVTDYPKMNELYEMCKIAYNKTVEEENIFRESDYYEKLSEDDIDELKFYVAEDGYFWCKKGLKDFIMKVYLSDVELFMDNRRY